MGSPTTTLKAAASAAPTGRVSHGDQPAFARSTVVYAPMPTKAEYPSDTCPANPPRRFQAEASTT